MLKKTSGVHLDTIVLRVFGPSRPHGVTRIARCVTTFSRSLLAVFATRCRGTQVRAVLAGFSCRGHGGAGAGGMNDNLSEPGMSARVRTYAGAPSPSPPSRASNPYLAIASPECPRFAGPVQSRLGARTLPHP